MSSVLEAAPPPASRQGDVRRQLATELHDQVVQELTATLIDLENFKEEPYDEERVAEHVEQVQSSLRRTLRELRELLYSLQDEDVWQPDFMTSLRDAARAYTERTGMKINVAVDGEWPARIRSTAAKHMQRIILEAVNNARLHSGASSVWVSLRIDDEGARVTVKDDGRGLDHDTMGSGLGTPGMRERAALLGGAITIESRPEKETAVQLDFPRSSLD